MTGTQSTSVLAAYETPRTVRLAPNLHAACFSLMKLLPARFMLDRAAADGRLPRGGHIAETTSGTFGLALAMLAAVRGYQLTLVSASSLLDDRFRRRIEQLGAEVVVTQDPDRSGNQLGRLHQLETILAERPGTFWPRQYDNPDNPLAYARLAELVLRGLGQVDCLVGCVGSGGSLCGTGGFLRSLFPQMKIIAVDTHSSVLFGHTPGPRLLRGLGNTIMPANLIHEMVDEVHWVGALPAFAAARALYREHALYMGPTSGAAVLVAKWHARNNPAAATMVILADEGHRYHGPRRGQAVGQASGQRPPRRRG
jgi:cysteine synthase A